MASGYPRARPGASMLFGIYDRFDGRETLSRKIKMQLPCQVNRDAGDAGDKTIANCELRIANCEFRVARERHRDAGLKSQGPGFASARCPGVPWFASEASNHAEREPAKGCHRLSRAVWRLYLCDDRAYSHRTEPSSASDVVARFTRKPRHPGQCRSIASG